MFNKRFLKDAVERAIATAAETAAALYGGDALFNILNVDLSAGLGVALGAAVLSLLKSVAAAKATDDSISPASLATDSNSRDYA